MPTSVSIQSRDLDLLGLLLHCRVLSLKHAAALVFSGSTEAAKKRVQKLKGAGFILERRRKAYEPGILFLSKSGFVCLREHGALPENCTTVPAFSKRAQISELTLRHELNVLDVKVAFHKATQSQKHLTVAEFSTWPRLYEFTVHDTDYPRNNFKTVKPDGFIRLHEEDKGGAKWEHLFFLEVDRSTETVATMTDRSRLYNLFYRSGGMAKRFGKSEEAYAEYPFRVLVVCKSKERRDNLALALLSLRQPILNQVCLATIQEVCADPFSKVWRFPSDYRGVMGGGVQDGRTINRRPISTSQAMEAIPSKGILESEESMTSI